eukprot:TRINITY_DN1953_c0_g2_i1.p1 TRINITY_DN1953_c0_g2~~TRINITY_DN1953_c0_g2_i1.p1  ORF type:complete len:241 (+),score=53.20 TRINITY_DN1953_c0_g2_i1:250-972(+)
MSSSTPLSLQLQYDEAVNFLNNTKIAVSTQQQLEFYSYFKQITIGPCNTPKPGLFDFIGKSKWEAWKGLGSMGKEEAMQKYVDLFNKIAPEGTSTTSEGTKATNKGGLGPTFSTMAIEETDELSTICDFSSVGDLEKVKKILESDPSQVNFRDECGRTALNWSCDRGFYDITKYLIENGADINSQDEDGSTPLHYASLCGHKSIVNLLKEKGANVNIIDKEDNTPIELSDDDEIKQILKF